MKRSIASLHGTADGRLRFVNCTITSALTLLMCACGSGTGDPPAAGALATAPVVQDAATRASPVVPGRRARVFIFAGVDGQCRPQVAPQLAIVAAPAKGEVAFVTGQTTSIAASAKGTCIGASAIGTAVYYTAREGTSGDDRFTVEARSATGEILVRAFAVRIEP